MRATYTYSYHLTSLGAHGASLTGPVAVAVAVMVGLCVLITWIMVFTEPPTDRRDGRDGDSGPGGGGRGPGGGRPDGPHPAGGDPVWWPEFERQFADYVTSTIRA